MAVTLPFSGSAVHINGEENGSDVSFEDTIEIAPPRTVKEQPAR